MATPLNEWETTSRSDFVSIGTHRHFVQVAGPPRKPEEPIVVIICGLGSTAASWPAVVRQTSGFARIMAYDRTGLGRSEPGPASLSPFRSAAIMARELSILLDTLKICGPYILVSHSYGGVIAREFIAIRVNEIVGAVFVDTNTEHSYSTRPFKQEDIEDLMACGIDYYEETGLDADHKLKEEEWQALKLNASRSGTYAALEDYGYETSCQSLAEHKQFEKRILGSYPVSVVKGNAAKDIERLYNARVQLKAGSQEQREAFKKKLDTLDAIEEGLQREQLQLSSCSRYVYAKKSGHNVQLTEPELVVSEIKWVLDKLNNRQ